jgi:hypothetical protein
MDNKKQKIVIYLLLSLTVLGYCILINEWKVVQISDFLNYYQEAIHFKNGMVMNKSFLFFQAPGQPVFASLWMSLINTEDIKAVQYLNIVEYIISLMLIYWTYKNLPFWAKTIGLLSTITCVSYLSLMVFCCAEFNFIFFFLVGNVLIIKLMNGVSAHSSIRLYLLCIATAVAFACAQFVRPLCFYYVLFFVIAFGYLCYFKRSAITTADPKFIGRGIFVGVLLVGISMFLYHKTTNKWNYQPAQNGLWSVFVGLNTKAEGRYNAEDIDNFKKLGTNYQWQEDSLRHILKVQTLERAKSGIVYNLVHLPKRATRLLIPYYTSYWFFEKTTVDNKLIISAMKFGFALSSILALLAFVANLWHFGKLFFQKSFLLMDKFVFCALASIYLYLIIHLVLLEIQPRYASHIIFINLWFFPFALVKMNISWKK